MSSSRGAVEVLDATDPLTTERVCRLVRDGSLGLWTLRFWYLCAELVIVAALTLVLAAHLSWWVAVLWAVPIACITQATIEWTKLTLRIGIRSGDQWYVLEGSQHRAVALVKTRGGKRFVARTAHDSRELSRELRAFSDDHTRDGASFLTPGLGV
ncbi:MAG: hypothetical protein WA966_07545 [Ornithinimicrobium sp.]